MNTTSLVGLTMALAVAMGTTACVEDDHPAGPLTGELCFEGFDAETWIPMVKDGFFETRVGRLRQKTEWRSGMFGGGQFQDSLGFCDVTTEPVTVMDAEVEMYEGSGMEAFVIDGGLRVTTAGVSRGDVHLRTSHGDVTFATMASKVTANITYLDAQHERDAFDEEPVPVIAGGVFAIDVQYSLGKVGEFEWSTNPPWTLEDRVWFLDRFDPADYRGDWRRVHQVRATRGLGVHEPNVPGGSLPVRDWIEVRPVGAVEEVRLCKSRRCVGDGEALTHAFPEGSGVPDAREVVFDVVFRDADGVSMLGRPDDFALTYPEGWRDVRGLDEVLGGVAWRLKVPEGEDFDGEIEVTAYGRTITVQLEPR